MTVFTYDKSFEGLLTAVFDAYMRKTFPVVLLQHGQPPPLFVENLHEVISNRSKADRVWKGLCKKIPKPLRNMVLHVWLSEVEGNDILLFRYICKMFDNPSGFAYNFADPDVLEVKKIAHKVSHEGHRMCQFVRFQKAADGSWFAPVSPQHNALPLSISYFKDRFSDQQWLIYDVKRRYGYYYDLKSVKEVTIEDDGHLLDGKLDPNLLAGDEQLFQTLWQKYFKALSIKERINPKLQRQHMPRRYWKFLTEKQA